MICIQEVQMLSRLMLKHVDRNVKAHAQIKAATHIKINSTGNGDRRGVTSLVVTLLRFLYSTIVLTQLLHLATFPTNT